MKRLVYLFIILMLFTIYTTSGYARSGIGLIKIIESDGSPEAYVNTIVVGDGDLSATGAQATIQTSGGTSTEQTITITDTGEDSTKGTDSITPTDGYLKEIIKVDCQDDDACDLGFTETGDEDEGDAIIVWNTGTYDVTISEDADTVHIPLESVTLKQSETKEFIRGTVKWLTNAETQISKFQGINLGKGVVTGARKGLAKSTSYTLSASVDDNEMNSTVVVDTADVVIGIPADQCDTATHQTVCVTKTTASTVSLKSFDAVDKFTIPGSLLDAGDEVDLAAAIYSSVCYECIAPNVWGLISFSGTPTDGGSVTGLLADANCQGVWKLENNLNDSSTSGSTHALTGSDTVIYETATPDPTQGTYDVFLDGTYYLYSADTAFDELDTFSFGTWVRFDTDVYGVIMSKSDDSTNKSWKLFRDGSSDSFHLLISDDGTTEESPRSANDTAEITTWYHVVVAKDADEIRLYLDGVEHEAYQFPCSIGMCTAPLFDSSANLEIGRSVGNPALIGNIDEPFYYDRALSDGEVLAIYNQTSAGHE